MIKYFVITALVLLCVSWLKYEKEPRHVYLAHKIRDAYIADVTRDKRFRVDMIGGAMMGDIQQISIGLCTIEQPSVDEARIAYVTKTEEFIKRLNAWEEIRPYLHDYPATFANFDFTLTYNSPTGGFAEGPTTVAYMSVTKNTLYYSRVNPVTHYLDDLYSEPYATALAIVREQHPELL